MNTETGSLFRTAHAIETHVNLDAPIDELWRAHDAAKAFGACNALEVSLLDLKIEIARRIFRNCHFCERRCYVDRSVKPGFCGVTESNYSSEFLHYGEERELVPSHTIFFTGCTFTCVFCQNWEISRTPSGGIRAVPEQLALRVWERSTQGSRNVNWVGGDPTPHLFTILKTMKALCDLAPAERMAETPLNIPMVFNSNTYYSSESARLLDGVTEVYLSDFKYGDDACAKRYSHIDDYFAVVTRNLLSSRDRLLIRHLVMPGHVECCTQPIVEWTEDNIPEAKFNLMFQYTPYNVIRYPEINRYLRADEISSARKIARHLNLV